MDYKVPKLYPKQEEFCKSKAKYTCYGGARGGGKSFVARIKAILLALYYPGIQILLLRRTLNELRENHVMPLQKELKCKQKEKIAQYKSQEKVFDFPNGSRIILGYCDNEADVLQYQGQAYEAIFIEEATHFTEFQFNCLKESNRLSGQCRKQIKPRMYLTCNPGGVGHTWVKRLFIDRDFSENEDPKEYKFIPALVYENEYIMKNDPNYVKALESLPEDRRRAMLYGDWDIFEGQFFTEFKRNIHIIEPFEIPKDWYVYFVIDYGLDKLAGYWIAVDYNSNAYVFREVYESNLLVSEARDKIKEMTNESIYLYLAPPDLWNRHKETGKSTADIFAEGGIDLYKTNNDRIQGWLQMKEWLKPYKDEQGYVTAKLKIFNTCKNLIRCLPQIQHDTKKVGDIANEPHELTHSVDAIRGFCVYWTQEPIFVPKKQDIPFELQTEDIDEDIWY